MEEYRMYTKPAELSQYSAICEDEDVIVYCNNNILYTITAHEPDLPCFDKKGNCIFVDYFEEEHQEYLVHISNDCKKLGTVSGLHCTELLLISDNGLYALALSDLGVLTTIDLSNHNIIKQSSVSIQNSHVRSLLNDQINARFKKGTDTIDFELGFDLKPINISQLLEYHINSTTAPKSLTDNYYTLLEWCADLLPKDEYLEKLTDTVCRTENKRYFSEKRLAKNFRKIGECYLNINNKEKAIYFLEKAIEYDSKVGAKTLLNKLKSE